MNNKVLKRWVDVIEFAREEVHSRQVGPRSRCIVDLAEEVDRLQEEVEVLDHGEVYSQMYVDSLETELAKCRAENDRLRFEMKRTLRQLGQRNADLADAQDEIETLRAENERLQKALGGRLVDDEAALQQTRLDRNTTDAS